MAKWPELTSTGNLHVQLRQRTGPTINRGKGNNSAATPWKFIRPVDEKFGPLEWDLAASIGNEKAKFFLTEADNSLAYNWHMLWTPDEEKRKALCWLNPPFANITPWARKCAEECQLGARILLLVPASVGANWYWDWVVPHADVYSVGRMVFDDCYDKAGKLITTVYPKDLILCEYDWPRTGSGKNANDGIVKRWRWQSA